ncbi:MAG TPA: OmpH family outer membrane protein [Myxococcaceae bacterium]|nr:OmpH family outer membrane protein [Myxococcaceae bacterium]
MSLRSAFTTLALAAPLVAGVAHAAEFKAGYVDLQRALLEVEEGRAAKARLKKMVDEKQKELDKEQEALRKEMQTLEKQATAMSEETRIKKQSELQQRALALGQKWEKGQAEMTQTERKELQVIFSKMDPIIAEIAQREGLTMVFEKADSGLVYAPPALDLTNELVRVYNARAGKKGAPAGKDAPVSEKKPAPAPKDAPVADKKK